MSVDLFTSLSLIPFDIQQDLGKTIWGERKGTLSTWRQQCREVAYSNLPCKLVLKVIYKNDKITVAIEVNLYNIFMNGKIAQNIFQGSKNTLRKYS